jgi:L-malate glycosyltransferase
VRLLIVNYEYPPIGGGGGVLTRTLVRALGADDVTVLTSRAPGLPVESFNDGARVLRLWVPGRRDLAKASMASLLAFPPSAGVRARMLLGAWRPELVHTFFAVPSGPVGQMMARRVGAPHVLTVIGADIHDPTRRISPERTPALRGVVRRVIRNADAVTAISSDIAARARHISGRDDIRVVPCAIDETSLPQPARAELGWGKDEFVVLTIARLVRRKAVDVLLRALSRTPGSIRLEVIGEGPELPALRALAASLPHRVTFTGWVDEAGKARRLVSADAFVLPSLHEGFGLVLLEAMRAGLPVIATASGGPPDFVEDGRTGFLVRPGDESALADRIARLAGDLELRRRMGAAGREGSTRFSPERMAAEYREIYEGTRTKATR